MAKLWLVVCIALLLSACGAFKPRFKESLVVNGKIQEAQVQSLATGSVDVVDFADKIFANPPVEKQPDHVKQVELLSESKTYNFLDTQFFRKFCESKNGELSSWSVDRNYTAFSGFRGHGNEFITCDKENKVEAALVYETYGRESKVYPYGTIATYAKSDYFEKMLDEKNLYGFASSNRMITFPSTRVTDPAGRPRYVSDSYSLIFDYSNESNEPVELNLLNSSVIINGAKYRLGFEKGRDNLEKIDWTFYHDGNSPDIFIGPDGSQLSKIRLNPGQRLYGEFKIKIPGKKMITEDDIAGMTFDIDGHKCEKFKKVSYFDMFKAPLAAQPVKRHKKTKRG